MAYPPDLYEYRAYKNFGKNLAGFGMCDGVVAGRQLMQEQ